jgi:antitoxin (DNA-binding transcriptional repressor) of toxin-antitoxin stability system
MSTRTVSVQEAEKRLAELIGLAQQGDEIVITRDDQARVKLVPIPQKANKRVFGQHRGKIRMREDFDALLPEDFWLGSHP